MSNAQCVLLNNHLYVGGGEITSSDLNEDDHAQLFMSSTDLNAWSEVTTPCYWYGLSTYHSQIVLVGGKETSTDLVTNKIWTLCGDTWHSSLPPMPTARHSPTAVTITQDLLVVAGGRAVDRHHLDTVEVLTDQHWSIAQPLPGVSCGMSSTLHNGKLYLAGGHPQEKAVYCCAVKSLVDSCTHPDDKLVPLWSLPAELPLLYTNVASYCNLLFGIGGRDNFFQIHSSSKIHAYSPLTRTWVHVGDMPVESEELAVIILPNNDFAIFGGELSDGEYSDGVFRASLRSKIVTLYPLLVILACMGMLLFWSRMGL